MLERSNKNTYLPYSWEQEHVFFCNMSGLLKVRYFRKADWRAVDSPKKRTDKFDLFAEKSKKANKTNLYVHFLGESMARQSAFEIN